ncbi:MAG: hypothetical protein LBU32_10800 [Clostridiales bacterium]|nr:hypothetical protein [Clostridiales bacterium]
MNPQKTRKGIAVVDRRHPLRVKASDEEMARIPICKNTFQGIWNQIIFPSREAMDEHARIQAEMNEKGDLCNAWERFLP